MHFSLITTSLPLIAVWDKMLLCICVLMTGLSTTFAPLMFLIKKRNKCRWKSVRTYWNSLDICRSETENMLVEGCWRWSYQAGGREETHGCVERRHAESWWEQKKQKTGRDWGGWWFAVVTPRNMSGGGNNAKTHGGLSKSVVVLIMKAKTRKSMMQRYRQGWGETQ